MLGHGIVTLMVMRDSLPQFNNEMSRSDNHLI